MRYIDNIFQTPTQSASQHLGVLTQICKSRTRVSALLFGSFEAVQMQEVACQPFLTELQQDTPTSGSRLFSKSAQKKKSQLLNILLLCKGQLTTIQVYSNATIIDFDDTIIV